MLLLGLLIGLRWDDERPWLRSWAGGAALLSLGHGVFGAALLGWLGSGALLAAMALFATGLLMVLRGVGPFVGHPPASGWYALLASGPLLGGVSVLAGASTLVGASVGMVTVGVGNGVVGLAFLRTGRSGSRMAGGALLVLALHSLGFPLALGQEALLPYGLVGISWLQLVAGLGVAFMHLGSARADAENAESAMATFIEQAVVGVYRTTPDGRFLFANQALVRMLGYETAEQVLALKVPDDLYLDPNERVRLRRASDGEVLTGYEATWRRSDGRPLIVALDRREVRGAEGEVRYWEGFARDVTRARMLEGELARSQRMEALGRLAGGVAHDFNNLLTVILGNLGLVQVDRLGEDQLYVDAAMRAVEQGAELSQQLLNFGRPVDGDGVVDAREVLADAAAVLERAVGPSVEVVTSQPDRSCWVPLPRPRFSQVVMNLVLNARDAMPDGGTIRASLAIEGDGHGRRVVLAVADEGEGMAPEVVEHIFEPFFTTRASGVGTGLGLATVYMAVQEANGTVTVESQPGHGSTFRVDLPLAKAPEPSVPPVDSSESSAAGVVYVVDDQDAVRSFVVRCLERAGYEVRDHSDPDVALEEVASAPPDLLLTDVVMPGRSGPELVAALRERAVHVPVLFMSGYPRPGDDAEPLPGRLLQKPFTPDALHEAIAKVLQPA